jgi:hypothetical protein
MGSKSSKWLAASLVAVALAVVPVSAVAKLDYSRNSVNGQYLPAAARVLPQVNDVPLPAAATPARAPVRIVAPSVRSDNGFSWGSAFAGAGVALLLAGAGAGIVRRRHTTPLVS